MSGILFLGSADFVLRQGEKGPLLCLSYEVAGLALVLFYSDQCVYCDHLIKKFKQLPYVVNGCQFAMVNVSKHTDIPERSQNTVATITYVPDLILYVNGNPYVRYDGPHELEAIQEFVVNVYKKIQQIHFTSSPQASKQPSPQQHYSQSQIPQSQQPPSNPYPPQSFTPSPPAPHSSTASNYPYGGGPGNPGNTMPPTPSFYPSPSTSSTSRTADPIPAYTVGQPLKGNRNDRVCYLNFNHAYSSSPATATVR